MNRASAADLRKAAEVANSMLKAGILFVPMPVADAEEHARRVAEAGDRLEQMAQAAEAAEKGGV